MEKKIKNFIIENFMSGQGDVKNNDPLFTSGIIDSLGFITLLAFIEKTFNISVNMSEITMDNFNTIDAISTIIKNKKAAR